MREADGAAQCATPRFHMADWFYCLGVLCRSFSKDQHGCLLCAPETCPPIRNLRQRGSGRLNIMWDKRVPCREKSMIPGKAYAPAGGRSARVLRNVESLRAGLERRFGALRSARHCVRHAPLCLRHLHDGAVKARKNGPSTQRRWRDKPVHDREEHVTDSRERPQVTFPTGSLGSCKKAPAPRKGTMPGPKDKNTRPPAGRESSSRPVFVLHLPLSGSANRAGLMRERAVSVPAQPEHCSVSPCRRRVPTL